jgi:hypothetical protein
MTLKVDENLHVEIKKLIAEERTTSQDYILNLILNDFKKRKIKIPERVDNECK